MSAFSKKKLEEVAHNSLYSTFTNAKTIEYSFRIFSRFLKKGYILELGPAEGLMTEKLITLGNDLTVVEGSENFASKLIQKYPTVKVINSLFEDCIFDTKFDNIILGHVLDMSIAQKLFWKK